MARSPASPLRNVAVAATGYVAFWALLGVAVFALDRPPAPWLATSPSHARGAPTPWAAVAHRVYDEIERRVVLSAPPRRPGALGAAHEDAAAQRRRIARTVLEEAARAAMDPLLVLAVIQVESAFDPRAVSPVGAAGLMQLLTPTMHEELGRWRLGRADPFDPVANVRAGVRYLERMLWTFEDLDLALMAYNAGPARIRRHLRAGGVPARFLAYPRSVVRARARLAAGSAPASLGAAHAGLARGPSADLAGGLAPASSHLPHPAVGPVAPLAAAVPSGPRRRELTDT